MTYTVTRYEDGELEWELAGFETLKNALWRADFTLEIGGRVKVTVTDENGKLIAESRKNKWWNDLVLVESGKTVRYNQNSWGRSLLIQNDDGYWDEYEEETV